MLASRLGGLLTDWLATLERANPGFGGQEDSRLATLERANPGFGGQEGQGSTPPHDLLESVPDR